jgi:hypothetical protein
MPDKNTFDWMRQQLNGFMRTQIIGAAAALSLGDHLRNGPRAPYRRSHPPLESIAG